MLTAVTLSPRARATAARLGIPEIYIKGARIRSSVQLVAHGQLADGHTVRLICELERPYHILDVEMGTLIPSRPPRALTELAAIAPAGAQLGLWSDEA